MRLPLVLAILILVAVAGCTDQANVTLSTPTLSASAIPLAAPTVEQANSTPSIIPSLAVTRTPRAAAATKIPSATPTPLDIEGQQLPVPADAKETKNIPAVARSFAQNQLKGQARIGQPYAFVVPQSRSQMAESYRQELTASGWEAIPITGLQDPIDVLFAQKANVRATLIFATEDNGTTLLYIVATRP